MADCAPSIQKRGSWEFGHPFLFVPGEEGDKQQAIYNSIDGSQTASFFGGDGVTSDINTSNYLHLYFLSSKKMHMTNTYLTDYTMPTVFLSPVNKLTVNNTRFILENVWHLKPFPEICSCLIHSYVVSGAAYCTVALLQHIYHCI